MSARSCAANFATRRPRPRARAWLSAGCPSGPNRGSCGCEASVVPRSRPQMPAPMQECSDLTPPRSLRPCVRSVWAAGLERIASAAPSSSSLPRRAVANWVEGSAQAASRLVCDDRSSRPVPLPSANDACHVLRRRGHRCRRQRYPGQSRRKSQSSASGMRFGGALAPPIRTGPGDDAMLGGQRCRHPPSSDFQS